MKTVISFLFPILIILFGLILYKVLDYEPNFYTSITNIGLAYILSPKFKIVDKQSGAEKTNKMVIF